jgi:ankyrin repeat protein
MVKASRIFYGLVLANLFLLMPLDGMSFSRAPRFSSTIRGVCVAEPQRRSLASMAVTPQTQESVTRSSALKKMAHSPTTRDLKGLDTEHKVGMSAAPVKKAVAVMVAPMKVQAVAVDERHNTSQATVRVQLPVQQAVSGKDAKQAVKVEAIEVSLASSARSVRQSVATITDVIIDVKSAEALYSSLHNALETRFRWLLAALHNPLEARLEASRFIVSALRHMQVAADSIRNDVGQTALHLAADCGDVLVVGVLLRAGAKVGTQDSYGLTALHYAAYKGDVAVVNKLLLHAPEAAVATADAKTMFGFTPMHWLLYNSAALKSEAIELVVELLILARASVVSIADLQAAKLPIHMASANGLHGVVAILLDSVSDTDAKLPEARRMVNAPDKDGWTALHYAASFNWSEVVVTLLKAGAAVTLLNKYYQTPRMLAVQGRHTEIAALLEKLEKNPSMSRSKISLRLRVSREEQVAADLAMFRRMIGDSKSS